MIYVLYFSNAGAPAPGLFPEIDTYKKVSDGSDVASPPAVLEIGGGAYKFTATPAEALFVRVDAGAALTDPDRYKVLQITPNDADLDAAITTRSTLTAQQVWEYATRTLSSFGSLVADAAAAVWASVTRSLTDKAGFTISGTKQTLDALQDLSQAQAETAAGAALTSYDPPTKAELDAAVSPLALEAGLEAHLLAVLNSYDPPTRAEASADKAEVLAAVAGLNDITVGELLAGDISDSLNFPANSLADLVRKLFWVVCNRLVITDASGAFTAYKTDGVTPAAAGTITDNGATTARSKPTWP
jgi:hypothetical protein